MPTKDTTDGFHVGLAGGANAHLGTIVVAVELGEKARYAKLFDDGDKVPTPPLAV